MMTCTDIQVPEQMNFTVEPGNMVDPTVAGVNYLVNLDAGASWSPNYPFFPNADGTFGEVVGGCMAAGTCSRSPRWRAIPVFDVENYMAGHRTGRGEILVTGFVGVFLQGMVGTDVRAYLTTFGFNPGPGTFTTDTSSFLRNVILVR